MSSQIDDGRVPISVGSRGHHRPYMQCAAVHGDRRGRAASIKSFRGWFRKLEHSADGGHIADHGAAMGALVDANALDLAEGDRLDRAAGCDGFGLQHGNTS